MKVSWGGSFSDFMCFEMFSFAAVKQEEESKRLQTDATKTSKNSTLDMFSDDYKVDQVSGYANFRVFTYIIDGLYRLSQCRAASLLQPPSARRIRI